MNSSSEDKQTIKETLNVIRKALNENANSELKKEDILLLNKLIKSDGTVEVINNKNLRNLEIKELLDEKLSENFEKYFKIWLEKNADKYFKKYLSNKN
tara:strand:+ start:890 stop:1183 length:294 start_codon:yes stop_codon:yes gene_type:complete